MANTINVSALPAYVDQVRDELLVKSMLGAKTLTYIDTMLDVKSKSALTILDPTVVFADATTCGFNAQGTDVLSQRVIEVKPIKVNKEWCDRSLLPTWMNHNLRLAAGMETLPFEQVFVDGNLKAIKSELEKTIWQGDVTSGATANLKAFNGFINILTADPSTIDVSVASGSTASKLIDAVYSAIPETAMEQEPVIFVSYTMFRSYVQERNATAVVNQPVIDANAEFIYYPGDSRVRIIPVGGLEGVNYAVAGAAKNFVYGTDIEGSENIFKLWYSDDDDVFKFKVLFSAGVNVKMPSEIVLGQIQGA